LYKLLKPISSPRGFTVLPIHYSHDPEKVGDWAASEMEKYKKDYGDWEGTWNREMELDFTSVPGALAYPSFSEVNTQRGLAYNESLPLCLACDFNVEPMVWEIAQVVNDTVLFIDEIKLGPTSVEDMVREFRNRYPAHPAEVWIYGDSTGNKRTSQTSKSDYDLLRLHFRSYPSPRVFKVSFSNPPVKERVNAVNLKLRGTDGRPGILIDPDKCRELVRDLKEVIIKDGKVVKTSNRDDPYFARTHASDSAGYLIFREWPVVSEVYKHARKRKARPRAHYRGMSGL
jgi:hypothetical protein